MMTTLRFFCLCLAIVAVAQSDEITSESPIATDVTPTVSEARPTVVSTPLSPPPQDPPALDSRARILLEPEAQQDPNILILGSQQTPNFPTVRPTLDDGARAGAGGANNDWTPIVWPATRVPVSAVAASLTSTSSTRLPIRIRPTQLVDRPVPSIVTAPARIVSALPTRTVPPTGSPPRIRIPPPLSVTRFDFNDVATPRPTSESVPDSAISPSAPAPSELPVTIAPTETLTNQSSEATSPSATESTTPTSSVTPTEETLNATSPTTPTDVPVIDTLLKSSVMNETSAFNETEPLLPPSVPDEAVTDTPIDSSSFAPSVDINLVDSLPNDTDVSIVGELEAQVTDQPAQIDEDSVTTDLVAELESANDTLIDVEPASFTPDFQVNQPLTSTTTEAASPTSERAPIVSSVDVTSSTAPTTTNSLDETTEFSSTEPKLNDNQPEEVTGRSTSTLSTLSVLSTLFPALTRAPSAPTLPPTTPAPVITTPTTTSSTVSTTTSTATNPLTTPSVSFPSTFWTSPTHPPTTTFVVPVHHSAAPFTPRVTTSPPTTIHFDDPFSTVHSTYDFSGSTEPGHDGHHASTTIIAVTVSVAVVICLALLLLAFLVLRRRKARAVQGTCQPARMDAFSLENVSETNTWQRGKLRNSLRASKRSYLNQAFDDSAVFSVPLTAAQLALYMEKPITSIEAEFRNVATSSVRIDELPPGVETKNRYANVLPVPETRVHIRVTDNRPEDILEQYINANYIRGPKEEAKYYIACQGPMEHTVEDFWHMVWENQCRLIIQLTDLTENGVARCAEYLPPSEVLDCHRLYGDYQVTLKSRELRDKYVTSSVQLKRMEDNLVREITHLWYSSWPVTGVPEDGKTIVELLLEARKGQSKEQQAPLVVHCSPGTGRTGAALAIDVCMRQLDSSRSIDIPRCVHRLRQDRAGCVQTGEQYAFIYKAVSYYASQLSNAALDSL